MKTKNLLNISFGPIPTKSGKPSKREAVKLVFLGKNTLPGGHEYGSAPGAREAPLGSVRLTAEEARGAARWAIYFLRMLGSRTQWKGGQSYRKSELTVKVRVVEVANQTESPDRHFIEVALQAYRDSTLESPLAQPMTPEMKKPGPPSTGIVHLSTAGTISLADDLLQAADSIEEGAGDLKATLRR